jgi:hypothetical protein
MRLASPSVGSTKVSWSNGGLAQRDVAVPVALYLHEENLSGVEVCQLCDAFHPVTRQGHVGT